MRFYISLFLFLAFLFVPFVGVAEERQANVKSFDNNRMPNQGEPFSSANLKDKSICKYIEPVKPYNQGNPAIFRSVKNVYVFSDRGFKVLLPRDQWEIPILQPENIVTLAACALEEQHSSWTASKNIKIYTPKSYYGNLSEIEEDRNLTIEINLHLSDKKRFFKKNIRENKDYFKEKIVTVSVQYYRPDVHSPRNFLLTCARAFPYPDNINLYHKMLTKTLQSCLNNEYNR